MTNPIDRVIELVAQANDVLLLIHQDPDGDTIASSLALTLSLRQQGKNVTVAGKDPVPRVFHFLYGADRITGDFLVEHYDLIFVLDCGDLKRTGFPDRLTQFAKTKRCLVNIDHHRKSDLHKIANINLFDETVAATAELIYRLIAELRVELTPQIATCLLCGLYTDTGGFRHTNTTPKTLELASLLLERGAKLTQITKHLGSQKSTAALRLWGTALSRLRRVDSLGLVTSVVTRQDLTDAKAGLEDLAGLINLINSTAGSRAAMLFSQLNDGVIKVSLRTERNDVDVSRLAELYGGGGHKKAAGFTIAGKIKKDKDGWKIDLR